MNEPNPPPGYESWLQVVRELVLRTMLVSDPEIRAVRDYCIRHLVLPGNMDRNRNG